MIRVYEVIVSCDGCGQDEFAVEPVNPERRGPVEFVVSSSILDEFDWTESEGRHLCPACSGKPLA